MQDEKCKSWVREVEELICVEVMNACFDFAVSGRQLCVMFWTYGVPLRVRPDRSSSWVGGEILGVCPDGVLGELY